MKGRQKLGVLGLCGVLLFTSAILYQNASAESLPQWIKNTALWYGQGSISETEFLNAIKFLIDNDLIEIEEKKDDKIISESVDARVSIPNGNYDISSTGFYIPLNLEVTTGTAVKWVNDDSVPHTIQSQDSQGNIIGLFNSAPLMTGDGFEYTFEESGVYNYFCSLHPWRVGIVTVR
jgi:plastocyanin